MEKREKPKAGAYLLRLEPDEKEIWRRARSRAVLEGRSIRDVIIELLDRWAHDGGVIERQTRGPKKSV